MKLRFYVKPFRFRELMEIPVDRVHAIIFNRISEAIIIILCDGREFTVEGNQILFVP